MPILLLAIVGGVFWQATRHEFLGYDDGLLIWDNPHYTGPNAPDIAPLWEQPYGKLPDSVCLQH